jgi:hypothetical protein
LARASKWLISTNNKVLMVVTAELMVVWVVAILSSSTILSNLKVATPDMAPLWATVLNPIMVGVTAHRAAMVATEVAPAMASLAAVSAVVVWEVAADREVEVWAWREALLSVPVPVCSVVPCL